MTQYHGYNGPWYEVSDCDHDKPIFRQSCLGDLLHASQRLALPSSRLLAADRMA